MPVSAKFYMPVLKFKQGEYKALGALKDRTKDVVYPLFEIPPITYDYEADRPGKSIGAHIGNVIPMLCDLWEGRHFLLDMPYLVPADISALPPHPLSIMAGQARELGCQLVPVFSFKRDKSLVGAMRGIVSMLGTGMGLRLTGHECQESGLEARIRGLFDYVALGVESVDLIVDVGAVRQEWIAPLASGISATLAQLPWLDRWRSVTLVSSAFPDSLAAIGAWAPTWVPRLDWRLWQNVIGLGELDRQPNFGDYTTISPEPFDVDPRFIRVGCKVKYASDSDWLVVKARSVKKGGFQQYHELAQYITEQEVYVGPSFSWGDAFIKNCAVRQVGPGNHMTWVKVCVNHHVEFVVAQLANLNGF